MVNRTDSTTSTLRRLPLTGLAYDKRNLHSRAVYRLAWLRLDVATHSLIDAMSADIAGIIMLEVASAERKRLSKSSLELFHRCLEDLRNYTLTR